MGFCESECWFLRKCGRKRTRNYRFFQTSFRLFFRNLWKAQVILFFSFSHFVLIRRGFDWFGLIAG